ncbi:MAG: hypothetical protein HWQ41_19855 [Nostoc sp. NOS(2021)]|uniref:hypothetical protein n=1 Tax=Nostoc sp. NOS(2021) TaxID=2815407 RepID=UPI0025FBA662|nr:hypothetical protein [Nostoc sp. NOS(2021)]MBN3897448.1 hypothetical protein [Nostoc sp. NOS(2021)]
MQLKEFSLNSPVVESDTVLKALETAIPTEAIEQAMPSLQETMPTASRFPSFTFYL